MSRRTQLIEHTILGVLNAGAGYLFRDGQLAAEVDGLITTPRPLRSEHDDAVRGLESRHLILGVQTDVGVKWKITDAGRAYCAEHGVRIE